MESQRNLHTNYKRVVATAEQDWNVSQDSKLSNLNVEVMRPNYLKDQYGRYLHHFCTTSYLGLDYHPDLLKGATQAITRAGTLRIANSKNRCKLSLLEEYEADLSSLFQSHCLATLSCSAASAGVLPLLAAGVFTASKAPALVFDRFAHYSMNHVKAVCADETEVLTLPHNDINQLESLCRSRQRVAYIADGFYSMGGIADIKNLLYLQNRYGLFLYLDDSHALSTVGHHGWGHARSSIDELGENTLIVASLGKAFGAGGGLAMFGDAQQKRLMQRYGGPSNWSQSLNVAAIGAGQASIALHRSALLNQCQQKLQDNLRLFDSLISSEQAFSPSPIRIVRVGDATKANKASAYLAENGFLTSAVFFPVVPKNQAAVRITLRADMEPSLIRVFCDHLTEFLESAHQRSS
ncbi:aminotransferase class I/II-fold pyridoxal phosphate-dependent enzyme [Pseudomonas asplenii]|uniref:7-keto-8-aminopelargonate synthetase-like enzyme n=1 Tax=Pseudomonas asplenii TaxID=53407 RepID=A0A0N0E2R3_9PSED|nr:aminotransferase class I/II-fold pyridoxal phosphate-dependent enzyme [Pseudomonas fuscovaginae]KPA89212.1 7-keto-8-aminopelargonate synthetase-like enzyme [Pseudomonas fuscovaginae]KPA96730.1 7-keto-8-aminopelargonate synthetase-like enzyme [Pseudomonas fuscovaginae]